MPLLQTWSELDHPGKGQVWRVHQLPNGVMAFANTAGVLFFDGSRFDAVEVPGGTVYDLAIGDQQRIYVGTGQVLGYLQPDVQRRWQFVSLPVPANAPDRGDIGRVVYAMDRAFFLSRRLLLIYSQAAGWQWRGTESIYSDLLLRDGQVLVYEKDSGWLRFNPASAAFVPAEIDALPVDPIAAGTRQPGEPWYVTDRQTIYRRDGRSWTPMVLGESPNLVDERIEALARLPSGELAVATRFGGLYQFAANGSLRRRLAPELLPGERITDLDVDAEGALWMAIDGGLARLASDNRVTRFDRALGAAQIERIRRIDGVLYLATRTGLKRLTAANRPGMPAQFETVGISRTSTWDLLATAHGTLVATGSGLSVLGDPPSATARELFRGTRVSALAAADAGWIYAINLSEVRRLRWTGRDFEMDPQSLRLAPMFDVSWQENALWISIDGGGVFRLSDLSNWPTPTVTRFSEEQGIPDGRATFGADAGGFLLFLNDRALRRNGERFVLAPEFPPELALDGLTQLPGGDAWATRDPSGLVRLKRQAGGQYLIDSRPLAHLRIPARHSHLDLDGTLWLGGDRGLVRMRAPPDAGELSAVPQLRVSTAQGEPLAAGAALRGSTVSLDIPATARDLRVQASLPSYRSDTAPRWQYRSGGGHWLESSSDEFGWAASPGISAIEIRAVDSLGRASVSGVLRLHTQAFWHETAWARAVMLALLALLLSLTAWGYARWRTGQLERERARLEALVDERTQDMRRQAEEIRLLSDARTRFFANVSHEFRTPLTLILGPLGDAVGGRFGELSQGLAAALDTARANGKRLLRLVGELLDLSRLAAGRFDLHVSEHDLAEQMRRELAAFESQAQAREIDLQGEGLADPLLLHYDADQMERMVSNLLSNALKFTPRGGQVRLRLVPAAEEVGIEVEDNGPGVALSDQARVFERFYQGATPASLDAPGTGIGLSLVRELIELHQGRAELHSEPGQGSCFVLWFKRGDAHFSSEQMITAESMEFDNALQTPEWDPSGYGASAAADETLVSTSRPTLLVVDDHAELRRYVADRLGDAYEVITASDGEEALEQIAEALPDIVISDVMMPGVDGLTLARALRRDPDTAGVPLILLSARAQKRDVVAGLEAGADDYLSKPFDTSELIARIEAQLDTRRRLRQKLARELADQAAMAPSRDSDQVLVSFESATQRFAERLQRTLDEHIGEPGFGVGELADALHLDRATLFRRIKTSHQCTPSELLREQRLQRAQSLLEQQRGSVSEIAYACGYDNLSYFSQAFRKRFGLAPSALLASGS